MLERIATHARDLLAANDSEVYLVDASGERLRAIVALGAYAAEIKATTLRLGEGIVGSVALTGEAEMVNDAARDPRSIKIPATPDESESILCTPLRFKNRLQGVMTVVRTAGQAGFRPADLEFFKALAGQAAIAIENARLYAAEHDRASELARTLEQQRELDRLKNEFIQNISHELRTPLASLKALVETLRDGALDDPPAAQRFLDRVEDEVDVMAQIVQELLDLSRTESGQAPLQLKSTAVADFIVPPAQRLQPQAERARLTLNIELPGDLPPVLADCERLSQVVTNLVHNAIKFTPAGGTITVSAFANPDEVTVFVRDTGIGIPADDLPRIFERFYKADRARSGGGTGLGLAIARHVIQAHGGRIWAESVEGSGSTFWFTLPTASAALATS